MIPTSSANHYRARELVAKLSEPGKRERAAHELLRMDANAVPALIEGFQSQDPAHAAACRQLLDALSGGAAALRAILASGPVPLREGAADYLGLRQDELLMPALVAALKDPEYSVRYRAARALGLSSDPRLMDPLLAALKDSEERVRLEACTAVGRLNDPATDSVLGELLLDDPSLAVRRAVAVALRNSARVHVLPHLLEALHDSFWWYERESEAEDLLGAIEAMGGAAVEPLIEALDDKEGTVRKFAATLLGRLGDARAVEPLAMALYDLHHDVGVTAALALARFGAPAIGALTGALSHPEMWIRVRAVTGLGHVGTPEALPMLIAMLDDPVSEVQIAAIRALGNTGDRRAEPALQQVLSDRSKRELHATAREVLGKTLQ